MHTGKKGGKEKRRGRPDIRHMQAVARKGEGKGGDPLLLATYSFDYTSRGWRGGG